MMKLNIDFINRKKRKTIIIIYTIYTTNYAIEDQIRLPFKIMRTDKYLLSTGFGA